MLSVCPDNLGLAASQESFLMIIKWTCAWTSTLLGGKSVPQSVDDHKASGKRRRTRSTTQFLKTWSLGGLSMPLPF